ncbi:MULTISPECIES: enoyl-CoA hydratase/isomerase family protein [Pseudonocardia]|uniref:1,2-epoxyphenylacetyl-CoA isomerase n=2 Tax=Pseudonocardia TaxID=1847 RepID=A0A1Y2N7E9_PSEAH|nr:MULTISPECIES: enoyl-CoA hydratase-related protein [Pseudonocardia]OSY43111.1 1,2-epoxyphenylacetyl-CoA isomerase [Pseudonocardia autotrophica]TDN71599.1 2-(1,2-epoxy-1,2-dihydrophenyl)acetyl-CoA isomerase [Pseudonocardia autotrophica]BBG02287.1 putative enoyl-CoA hydratase/isomerase [Pseudonocardia autotrophica]GEC23377.1 putative enoyl-CoA hydratase/isomerase [Pseudonocardia saturnea]
MSALERDGRVLRCRVSSGRHGTLDGAAMQEVTAALEKLADTDPADPDGVGAVLLHGDGENFCTGGDVRAFAGAEDRYGYVHDLADTFHAMLRPLVGSPVPTVAAVPGWAAGAGMSIVLACDLAVGGRSTRLRPAYPAIGFSPDGGMTWTLPRLVGAARARRILLTDEVLDADALTELGVLASVVDDDAVADEAAALAHRLAQGPTAALGRIRGLLGRTWESTLDDQLAAESDSIATCAAGPEGTEGLTAFTEKRRPRFH